MVEPLSSPEMIPIRKAYLTAGRPVGRSFVSEIPDSFTPWELRQTYVVRSNHDHRIAFDLGLRRRNSDRL